MSILGLTHLSPNYGDDVNVSTIPLFDAEEIEVAQHPSPQRRLGPIAPVGLSRHTSWAPAFAGATVFFDGRVISGDDAIVTVIPLTSCA